MRRGVARIGEGDTTHLCACDADGLGVSLTQSNALDFGSHLVEPTTGVFLHNRGVGFSLAEGHPAEVRAGVRPPHTLSPMLVTAPEGPLTHLVGAMGGDAQPQIISQLLARLLRSGEDPARAISAPRLALDAPVGRPVPVVVGRRPHGARRGRRAARMVRRAHGARAQDSGHQRVRPRGRRLRADHRRRATSRGGTVPGGRLGPAQSRGCGGGTVTVVAGGRRVGAPLRVASLAKQIPHPEAMHIEDGRLVRAGVELEMNAYCRRAVAEGVTLATQTGGSCTVVTLGPPSAEDVLREAIAWGAGVGSASLRPGVRRLRHPGHGAGAGRRASDAPAPTTSCCSG